MPYDDDEISARDLTVVNHHRRFIIARQDGNRNRRDRYFILEADGGFPGNAAPLQLLLMSFEDEDDAMRAIDRAWKTKQAEMELFTGGTEGGTQ